MGCLNAKGRVSPKNKGSGLQVFEKHRLEINPATPSNLHREAHLSGDNATHLTGAGGASLSSGEEVLGTQLAFS